MNPSSGDFPIVPSQFMSSFNQGLEGIGNSYNNLLQAAKTKAQLPYVGQMAQADVASKLAYANLMGPQFVAKLMGNKDILANMQNPQSSLNFLLQAGSSPQRAKSLFQGMNNYRNNNAQSDNSQYIPVSAPPMQNSPLNNGASPNQISNAIRNMKPGQSITNNSGQPVNIPNRNYQNMAGNNAFAENTARYNSIVSEGQELGKNRADDIQDLGSQYESGLRQKTVFNDMNQLLTTPEFMSIGRDIPFYQQKQLNLLSKIGTPEQQQLIGRFNADSSEFIRDTINSFKGNQLKADMPIAEKMKPSDNDTFNVRVGKAKAAEFYNEMNMQRASIASDIMKNKHTDRQAALQQADKLMHADIIRDNINKKLNIPNYIPGTNITRESLSYSKGKNAPDGYIWMKKGNKTIAVHQSKKDEALKRNYEEVS